MKIHSLNQLIILLSAALSFSACQKDDEVNPDLSTIEYTLSTPEAGQLADIEYTSVFGIVMTLDDESLPWSISFNATFKIGDAISLHAESGEQGAMTAQIIVNDKVVAAKTATHYIHLDYIKGLK